MNEAHPDRNSFDKIWDKIIEPEIKDYKKDFPGCIEIIPAVKDEIWDAYVTFNDFTKKNYMDSQTDVLDKHKVSACYMAAIATVRPMRLVCDKDFMPLAVNERMAITVALSILRSYVITTVQQNEKLDKSEKDLIISKFDMGIYIPNEDMVWHGSYIDNYANELANAVKQGKLFILSLAHELYLLEIITRNHS